MIVPQQRLILVVALVGVPCAVAAALYPGLTVLLFAAGAALAWIAAADALTAGRRLEGVSAAFAETVRLTKGREGAIGVLLEKAPNVSRRVRVGIALPPGVCSPHETMEAALEPGVETFRLAWPCTGFRRGRYDLEDVHLETASALGLWAVRKRARTQTEVRVYPSLQVERKNLAALFMNRGAVGLHAQRQVGKGREFEQLREYIPGDSYEDIHWRATAKRGEPITKMFQLERTQEVYVVIDASRLSSRVVRIEDGDQDAPGAETTQLERFITAAMVVGLAAERQGDLFGVAAFDDQVRQFVRAKGGKAHYAACRDALYALEPRRVNPDFGELFTFLRLRLRRRALLLFLTNLDDPVLAEQFERQAELLSGRHLVLCAMIADPAAAPIFSAGCAKNLDDVYAQLTGHIEWRRLIELEGRLSRCGVSMRLVPNEALCPELVAQYLRVKRRQAL